MFIIYYIICYGWSKLSNNWANSFLDGFFARYYTKFKNLNYFIYVYSLFYFIIIYNIFLLNIFLSNKSFVLLYLTFVKQYLKFRSNKLKVTNNSEIPNS